MSDQKDEPPQRYSRADATPMSLAVPREVWRSDQLIGSSKEIVILHDGEEYRLRITRNNKLILTK